MNHNSQERRTITQIKPSLSIDDSKAQIADAGRRRHLSWGMDFDTRAFLLGQEIGENWEERAKELHFQNCNSIRRGLLSEFGEQDAEAKLKNFIAIGTKPFSVLSNHNAMFHQVRQAFVIGAFYPALVGACALGERILNHLILDMRDYFTDTPEYRSVRRKESFNDWSIPIDTLEKWEILLPGAVTEFRALMPLRHRSIHFNDDTYNTLRDDALAAILHMRTIIEEQFGSFGLRPWFIAGTKGHLFIRKSFETHPFVRTYFVPKCPFVGPLFGMAHGPHGWQCYDLPDYGDGVWTDEEFAAAYNARDPEQIVQPPSDDA